MSYSGLGQRYGMCVPGVATDLEFRNLPGIIGRVVGRGEVRHGNPRRAGGARLMPKGEIGGYFHE
jgi:hypothetical protein